MSKDSPRRHKGPRRVYIGYDPRQQAAYAVARMSVQANCTTPLESVKPIILEKLQEKEIYTRPFEKVFDKEGRFSHYYDPISEAPMATTFAISRFFMASLGIHAKVSRQPGFNGKTKGWALFMDCDMLVRDSLDALFQTCEREPDKAIFCVKHQHEPPPGIKMDGQLQLLYKRKNWTSVMAINLEHPANLKLTPALANRVPGRELHALCWLDGQDELIGELSPKWNWLCGYSDPIPSPGPSIVHYTEGGPWLAATQPEYENLPFADEWLGYITGQR